MPNKIKYTPGGPDIENKVTIPFSEVGQDGSGQGSQGTRTFLSDNHVRIVDVNSNTRQVHLIQGLTAGKEYTVSVEYLKITGAPTFRFQIQGYTDSTYRRTIKFTDTVETGLKDIDGWQTASWTFRLASNENAVRIWWQDGADYTTYTHSFELRYPALRESHMGSSSTVGDWSIGVDGSGMGPTSTGGFYNGLDIPEGGYVIYAEGPTGRTVANDEELMYVLNQMGASLPDDSVGDGLQWAKDNNVLVLNKQLLSTKKDSVVLDIDTRYIPGYFQQIPATNIISAGDQNLNNMIVWTNSGNWRWSDNASDVPVPFTNGSSGIAMMRGESLTRGSQHFGCASFGGSPSTTYTISVFYRQSRAGASSPYFRTSVNNNSLGSFNYKGDTNSSNWPVNKWIRISATATLQSNETGGYLSNYLGRKEGDIVWYYAPMVQLGDTMSPFVNGTRTQNSTLIDLSGKSNNGTINGEVVFDSNGAISFDGATNHVQVDSHPAFNVNERTIEITFKMNSAYGNYTPLAVYANGGSSTYRLWLGLQDSRFQMHGWGTTDPGAETIINVGEWYTCTFSYNNSTKEMKMYTNGKLERTMQNTQGGIPAQDGMNWYLAHMPGGESWAGGLTHSNVTIQSFRVHDRILSDDEVSQNYYEGKIVVDGLATMIDAQNTVSYVDGQGTSINDLTGTTTASLNNAVFNVEKRSFVLDGTDDFILINNPNLANAGAASLDIWFKMNAFNTTYGNRTYLVDPRGNGSNSGTSMYFLFDHETGDYVHFVSGCGNIEVQSPSTYLPLNTWHHAVVTIDDDANTIIYLNGKIIKSGVANPSTSLAFTNDYRVGTYSRASGSGYMLNGEISNYKMYTKVLTQEEVLQNYTAHRNRFK